MYSMERLLLSKLVASSHGVSIQSKWAGPIIQGLPSVASDSFVPCLKDTQGLE